ncbi:MAG: RrF2 family transcriptional regulator [Caldicoprobacterales bacterium]|nr:Rrf2 family transcriptional regulator [Clostridiales bacterium]
MKISTKGRYGLRAMIDLAVNSTEEHIPLSTIAENQQVSVSYLEQVFSVLRKAGLVKSIKGAQGGYILGDQPYNITVGMVLRVLEGDLHVVEEQEKDKSDKMQYCIQKNVWDKINNCINELVDDITLEDLAVKYQKMNGMDNHMYYI